MWLLFGALVLNFMIFFNGIAQSSGLFRSIIDETNRSKKDKNKIDAPATSSLMPPPASIHNPFSREYETLDFHRHEADIQRSSQQNRLTEMSDLVKKYTLVDGQHEGREYTGRENIDWLIQHTRNEVYSQGAPSPSMIQDNQAHQQKRDNAGRENIDWLIQHTLKKAPSYGTSSTMMNQADQIQEHQPNYSGNGNMNGFVHHNHPMAQPEHQSPTNVAKLSEQEAAYLEMERRLKSKGTKKSQLQMDETGKFRVPAPKKQSRFIEQSPPHDHQQHTFDKNLSVSDPQPQRRRKVNENAKWREVGSNPHKQISQQSQDTEHASQSDKSDLIQNDINSYLNPYHDSQNPDPRFNSHH